MAASTLLLTASMGVLLVAVTALVGRLEDWRSYTPTLGGGYGGESGHAHDEKPGGIVRWLTTVDHKDIGLLYGTFAVLSFAWGGVAVLLMRLELLGPASDFLQPQTYNALWHCLVEGV